MTPTHPDRLPPGNRIKQLGQQAIAWLRVWLQRHIRGWEQQTDLPTRRRQVLIGFGLAVVGWLGWLVHLIQQPHVDGTASLPASTGWDRVDSAYQRALQQRSYLTGSATIRSGRYPTDSTSKPQSP